MNNPELSLNPGTSYGVIGGGKWGGIHSKNIYESAGIAPTFVTTKHPDNFCGFTEIPASETEFYDEPSDLSAEALNGVDLLIVAVVPDAVEKVLLGEDGMSGLLHQCSNKTFFIEKPIAKTREGAMRIVEAAKANGHQLIMANQTRYAALWHQMLDEVGDDFGAIEEITIKRKFNPGGKAPTKYSHVTHNLGVHSIEEIAFALKKWNIDLEEITLEDRTHSEAVDGVVHATAAAMSVRGVPINVEVSQDADALENYTEVKLKNGDTLRFDEVGSKKVLTRNGEKINETEDENTVLLQLIDVFRHVDGALQSDPKTQKIIPNTAQEHRRIVDISGVQEQMALVS